MMKNYVAVDRLNPEGARPKPKKHALTCGMFKIVSEFSALNDSEAWAEFETLRESGKVGDSRLYRSKDWYAGKLDKVIVFRDCDVVFKDSSTVSKGSEHQKASKKKRSKP